MKGEESGSSRLQLDAEPMAAFFDARAVTYEAHMRTTVADFEGFYRAIAQAVPETAAPIEILDLGCGTGLELAAILDRVPNARVTVVDLSGEMLSRLASTYPDAGSRMTYVHGSYLDLPIEPGRWDVILAVMTLHHLTRNEKVKLYRTIRAGLAPGRRYVEGDYVVDDEEEAAAVARYEELRSAHPQIARGSYHIDLPVSVETQHGLLADAGLEATVTWTAGQAAVFAATPRSHAGRQQKVKGKEGHEGRDP